MNTLTKSQNLIMDTYARYPLTIVEGSGSYIYDEAGREYLDFSAGVSVNNLGHCHKKIVAAIKNQAAKLCHCSNYFWSEPQLKLAEELTKAAGLQQIFFNNSGAEANEGAIKLARKYHFDKGKAHKTEIITMERSFHGRTMATLTATGQEKVKRGFAPLLSGFSHVPFNDYEAVAAAVKENTAAIMLEPVQAEGGIFVATEDYLKKLRRLCDEKDILLIFDEVQCGLGRCGEIFCYLSYGVKPDIVTLAKSLGGGLPMGAFLARDAVASALTRGSHGSTFGGNPVAAAAGYAYLKALEDEGILSKVKENGAYLQQQLKALPSNKIIDVRGKGLLVGVEIKGNSSRVMAAALKRGVIILNAGAEVIRFLPPLNCTKSQIDKAVAVLAAALEEEE